MSRSLEPTAEEAKVIASLQRLARKWPDDLMLFSGAGSLHVCRMPVVHDGDPGWDDSKDWVDNNVVKTVYGIHNDGGDPY